MGDYLGGNKNEVMEGQFVNNGKREKRPPYQFRSGAVYEGEWIGKLLRYFHFTYHSISIRIIFN